MTDKNQQVKSNEVITRETGRGNQLAVTSIAKDISKREQAQAELKFRERLLNSTVDSIFVHDLDGRIILINTAAHESRGYTKDEMMAMTISELDTPEFARLLPKRIEELLKTGHAQFETAQFRKDGSVLPMEVSARVTEVDGKTLIISVARDISERQRSEEALVESEKKYRMLMDLANDAIFVADAETGILVEANQKASQLIGRPLSEIIGMPQFKLHPPEKAEEYRGIFMDYVSKGQGVTLELLVRHASGHDIPVEISSSVFKLGEKILIKGIFRNLTPRNRAKELSDSLNEISKLINSTLDVDEILEKVVMCSAEALGSETTVVLLRQKDEWMVKCAQNIPAELIGSCLNERQIPHIEFAATSRNSVVIDDFESEPHLYTEFMQKHGIRSTMVVPLIVRDVVIGCQTFSYHSSATEFTADQIDFAVKLGASVSLALENARLFSEQQEAKELSDHLNRINSIINSTLQISDVVDKVVASSATAIGADSAAFFLSEGDHWVLEQVHGPSPHEPGTKLPYHMLNPPPRMSENPAPIAISDACNDDRANKEMARKVGLRSLLLVPLVSDERVLGMLVFRYFTEQMEFSPEQIDFSTKLGGSISLALENARLFSEQQRIASVLQESLLFVPDRLPHVEIGHLYQAASNAALVGGDFYDFFTLQGDRVGVVIGDVSGKGLRAAALTSSLKHMIKSYAYEGHSPGAIISKTNIIIMKETEPSTFVTAFVGILDTQSGILTYSCAGHPPPIIKRQNGDIDLLGTGGLPIGVLDFLESRDKQQLIKEGDLITLYTDGVIEARCASNMFGENRLIDLIRNTPALSAAEVPKRILDELTRCKCTLSDDLAVVSLALNSG